MKTLRFILPVLLGMAVGAAIMLSVNYYVTEPNLRVEYVQDDSGNYTKCVVNNWGGVSCDFRDGIIR